jgi:predicted aldo/keto reductase-like oxidoreductase
MLAYLIDGVDMEYRTLGRSGLHISRLSLGAMTFGAGSGIWGEIAGLDRAQAARLVAVAAEQGPNYWALHLHAPAATHTADSARRCQRDGLLRPNKR